MQLDIYLIKFRNGKKSISSTSHRCPTNVVTGKQAVVIVGNCPNGTGTPKRRMATSFIKLAGLKPG